LIEFFETVQENKWYPFSEHCAV